jgi:hypothetical protein
MSDRKHIEIGRNDGYSDSIEAWVDDDGWTISVDNPWAGDTERGFGATCTTRISHADARRFAKWLLDSLPPDA